MRDPRRVSEAPTAGRLLRLLAMLQARREWPGGVLAQRLGVSARTVRRDVERLRELGYPIRSSTGPAGGYALQAGTAMPPLLLEDDEATAVAIALRTAARAAVAGVDEAALRALVKLEQVLPAPLRRRVRALGEVTATATAGGPPEAGVDPGVLTMLAEACREREGVRLSYTGRDGRGGERTVEPHALVAAGRRWYLLAFDPDRGGWRTFRVDRMASARLAARRFQRRRIPGGDPAAYVTRSIAGFVYRYEARLRLRAPAEQVRARIVPGWGTLRELPEGCVYETSDDDLDWLALRIARLGVDFELEGPPELRERLREIGARLAAGAAPRVQ